MRRRWKCKKGRTKRRDRDRRCVSTGWSSWARRAVSLDENKNSCALVESAPRGATPRGFTWHKHAPSPLKPLTFCPGRPTGWLSVFSFSWQESQCVAYRSKMAAPASPREVLHTGGDKRSPTHNIVESFVVKTVCVCVCLCWQTQ